MYAGAAILAAVLLSLYHRLTRHLASNEDSETQVYYATHPCYMFIYSSNPLCFLEMYLKIFSDYRGNIQFVTFTMAMKQDSESRGFVEIRVEEMVFLGQ